MALFFSPKIITDGLVGYFDVNNPKCVDATQTITDDTRLNNLAGGTMLMQPQDHTFEGTPIMSFTTDNSGYVYDQDGVTGWDDTDSDSKSASPNPGWKSISGESLTQNNDYTFICWFKYTYGTGNQRVGENIYGGGFSGRTSFYLSPSGNSNHTGVLRYADTDTYPSNLDGGNAASNSGSYSILDSTYGGNDNNWHMFASVDTGDDGNHSTKFYIDGVLKATQAASIGSFVGPDGVTYQHDTPDGARQMTWGSWSVTYGNMTGKSNCFMYYNKALSNTEILQNYNALKPKFL